MREEEKFSKWTERQRLSQSPKPMKIEGLRYFVNIPADATTNRMKQAHKAEILAPILIYPEAAALSWYSGASPF